MSLVGSHGVGKTKVYNLIKERNPSWQCFSEGVRHQVPSFGYEDPYKILDEIGIGAFELMNINSWSVVDPKVNTTLDPRINILTDRSSVDSFGYYLALRKSQADFDVGGLVKGMAKYYASLVDIFVYFPIGPFPLKGDKMRPNDKEYQKLVDEKILVAFKELGVPESKIHRLRSVKIDERVEEVLKLFV